MSRQRSTVIAVVVVVVVAIAVFTFGHRRAPVTAAESSGGGGPAVSLATARFGTLVTHIHAQGRVGAPSGSEAKLAFVGSGILARVDVHVGEHVTAGQPLAELETAGLTIDARQAQQDAAAAAAQYGGGTVPADVVASAQRKLTAARDRLYALEHGTGTAQSDATAAQTALRQAQAKVDTDRHALDRAQTLFAGGVAAQKDVEAARQQLALDQADADAAQAKVASSGSGVSSAVTQARADVAQAASDLRAAQAQTKVTAAQAGSAQARFAAAQRNLANAILRAPADGVVTQVLKHPGESVDPTAAAVVVGPPASSEVTVTVAGDAATEIRLGAGATIDVPARNIHAASAVRNIVPSVDPTTQTSTVVLNGVPAGAASGDAVDVTIDGTSHRGVLVPTDAIVQDPQSGKAVIFVSVKKKNGDTAFESREVDVHATDGGTSLIASGLKSGDRIAARGAFDLLAPAGGG